MPEQFARCLSRCLTPLYLRPCFSKVKAYRQLSVWAVVTYRFLIVQKLFFARFAVLFVQGFHCLFRAPSLPLCPLHVLNPDHHLQARLLSSEELAVPCPAFVAPRARPHAVRAFLARGLRVYRFPGHKLMPVTVRA